KELNAGIRKKGSAPARPKATNDKTAPSRRSRSRV
ncbi:TPA: tyrosine protein kinase, partial [Enterococcus faecium]|nr:tyrosine protein kinase [Enterococcus faecium]